MDFSELLEKYQVRKTKKQKLEFIEYIEAFCEERGYSCEVQEQKDIVTSRNIVVGDVESADILCTAHYDTCAAIPIPNVIMPKNIPLFVLYQLILVGIVFAVCALIASALIGLFDSWIAGLIGVYLILFAILYVVLIGRPNKHTANDNTSGVAALLSIMDALPEEERKKAAFVFFDYEELGMVGSSLFKKRYKKILENKLVLNFDCVSDGKEMLLIGKKEFRKSIYYREFRRCFTREEYEHKPVFAKSSNTLYPSDQMLFPKSVGIAAMRRAPVIGLYISRIHTGRDTVFDESNISYLTDATVDFISSFKKQ